MGKISLLGVFLECEFCKKPTLQETVTSYTMDATIIPIGMEPRSSDIKILYPEDRTEVPLTNLPETIEKRYMDALRIQDIDPSSFAVHVRKTLEAVCNYEKATGKTLSEKLDNLVHSKPIPKFLAEMAN